MAMESFVNVISSMGFFVLSESLTKLPRSQCRYPSWTFAEALLSMRFFANNDHLTGACVVIVGEGLDLEIHLCGRYLNLKGCYLCHYFPRLALMAKTLNFSRCRRHNFPGVVKHVLRMPVSKPIK
ncbi:hypothetical protein Fot_03493 [Forsythia ovata]|uniref:Uncharacterized protein n=1 Tax=Forsythia ovata TaxID=205694 RepID=A0ABD1XA03_9LAMI